MDDNKRAILFCPIGSESPYEDTSCTFFNIKGLTDTLFSLGLVTQETELLYTKDPNRSFLSFIKSRLKALKPVESHIDRATLVCCKQAQHEARLLNEYWNSTHKFHTQLL
jgi:hypothetical protein